jgi:acyl carrier protein
VVAQGEAALATDDLRAALGKCLPDYMIPAAFVLLPALPLTPNGKIDCVALPEPGADGLPPSVAAIVAPRSDTERKLAAVWSELLRIESRQFGVDHDFFDLGGQSLRAMQVLARVRDLFGTTIKPARFFDEPTIAGLARLIEGNRHAGAGSEEGYSSLPAIKPRARRH